MQLFFTTKNDPTLEELHFALALVSSKVEENPDLVKTNQDISLHSPAKKYLGTMHIRGN